MENGKIHHPSSHIYTQRLNSHCSVFGSGSLAYTHSKSAEGKVIHIEITVAKKKLILADLIHFTYITSLQSYASDGNVRSRDDHRAKEPYIWCHLPFASKNGYINFNGLPQTPITHKIYSHMRGARIGEFLRILHIRHDTTRCCYI